MIKTLVNDPATLKSKGENRKCLKHSKVFGDNKVRCGRWKSQMEIAVVSALVTVEL